jgi:crotonobetainyl-CoA:carnitine CoA-transferase CaiB-like acyl-CoA transferase
MTRPFEGIRVIDATHVLAGPFATYQLAVLGADEWEAFLQARHVPAAPVRTMGEAVADPQLATRGIIHRHASGAGIEGGFGVPLAAFTFAHGGPQIDTPPPTLGQHNEEILKELGVSRR